MFLHTTEFNDAITFDPSVMDEQVEKQENPYQNKKTLNLWQRFLLILTKKVYVSNWQKKGWNSSLPYYAFKCPTHGIQYTYPTGWNKILLCPVCFDNT